MELLVPVVIDCFVRSLIYHAWSLLFFFHPNMKVYFESSLQIDNLKLNYDNVTRTTSNQPGVEIKIPGWGDPIVVEYIDPSRASPGSYFKDIGTMLVNDLGYIRNLSLRGAPYDFRKGPSM